MRDDRLGFTPSYWLACTHPTRLLLSRENDLKRYTCKSSKYLVTILVVVSALGFAQVARFDVYMRTVSWEVAICGHPSATV